MTSEQVSLDQLDAVISDFLSLRDRSRYDDLSDLPEEDRQAVVSKATAVVDRITGPSSSYSREITRIINDSPTLHGHLPSVVGVVKALRDDVKHGYMTTIAELIHADLFADFLEMAEHLLDSGYKDAAAVITGSALESHLRELAKKSQLSVKQSDAKGRTKIKKADRINADLKKASIYSGLDQKSVTAWLGLRNNAAHGDYDQYDDAQVRKMIDGVRNFMSRLPA